MRIRNALWKQIKDMEILYLIGDRLNPVSQFLAQVVRLDASAASCDFFLTVCVDVRWVQMTTVTVTPNCVVFQVLILCCGGISRRLGAFWQGWLWSGCCSRALVTTYWPSSATRSSSSLPSASSGPTLNPSSTGRTILLSVPLLSSSVLAGNMIVISRLVKYLIGRTVCQSVRSPWYWILISDRTDPHFTYCFSLKNWRLIRWSYYKPLWSENNIYCLIHELSI